MFRVSKFLGFLPKSKHGLSGVFIFHVPNTNHGKRFQMDSAVVEYINNNCKLRKTKPLIVNETLIQCYVPKDFV